MPRFRNRYDRDYDNDYRDRWRAEHRAYDRGYHRHGWGRGFPGRAPMGYDAGYHRYGPYEARPRDRYDLSRKSRWETDYGDPYGDRISHTPVRAVRGEYHGPRDDRYRWDSDAGSSYAYPMSYEPYYNPMDPGYYARWPMRRGGYDAEWW